MEEGERDKERWKRGKERVELEEGGRWGGKWVKMKENEMRKERGVREVRMQSCHISHWEAHLHSGCKVHFHPRAISQTFVPEQVVGFHTKILQKSDSKTR